MRPNAAERALRAVALGCKNYLFAGSDAGGEWAARIYSLIGSAKLNGMDPEAYLTEGPDAHRRSSHQPHRRASAMESRRQRATRKRSRVDQEAIVNNSTAVSSALPNIEELLAVQRLR